MRKMQIEDKVAMRIDPTMSNGKWSPQKTLASPPRRPRTNRMIPCMHDCSKKTSVLAIDSMSVA
jgi:hypothetical protein